MNGLAVDNLTERIERLKFSRFHMHLLLMGGLGFAFEGLDVAIVAFVLPVLRLQWELSSIEIGLLGSATFVGYFIGATAAGVLGDLLGRKAVMMYALALYCVASVGSAFSQDWTQFLVWRIIAGAGRGAEAVIIAPFLSEFVAARYRGRFVGALTGFFSFGFVGAALLGYFVVPVSDDAWRYVLAGTGLPVIMLLWWRRYLPESPRWLISVGRVAEATRVVEAMERQIGVRESALRTPAPATPQATEQVQKGTVAGQIGALLRPRVLRTTLMCWTLWGTLTFCYYAFFIWIPSLLVEKGMTITQSFGYSLAMYLAQIPGFFSAAYFNELIGRRATITSYMALASVAALGLAFAQADQHIMIAGILLSFFINGTYAGVYAYTPEVYPTQMRATGTGVASAVGRIGAIIAPTLIGLTYPLLGFAGVFGMTTVVLLLGCATVLVLGVPTKNRSLEEITEGLEDGNPERPEVRSV